MVNYDSVHEIIDSGIKNMETIVDNVAHDDDTVAVPGADWLKYNGEIATQIYVNGNSYFGIGTNTENLKVNRRDAKLWYLYREEGTLYNYFKFLKIRWKGYSIYSSTSTTYLLTYDVIFWDNGYISIHMVDIPASYYNGTFSLTSSATVSYTPPSSENPDVTFAPGDSDNKTYTAESTLIELEEPFDKKYLVRSVGTLYTVVDGVLSALEAVEPTAELFRGYGVDDLPDGSLLLPLINPEVLYWQDSDKELPSIRMFVRGTPPLPQMFTSKPASLVHESIIGINYAEVDASEDVRFAITFDGGETWKAFSGDTAIWYDTSDTSPGMLASTFAAITAEQWAQVVVLGEYKLRFWLPSVTAYVKKVVIHYVNP